MHQAAKNLVAQAFQPVPKTLGFLGLFTVIKYIIALSSLLKSSSIKWLRGIPAGGGEDFPLFHG
jgi:hypothetical protein